MSEYGELLDDLYDPEIEYIYNLFVKYFNNPTMTKIKEVGEYSMYATKIDCLLTRECRYIIAITNKNRANIGTLEELDTIKWISLQTRTLSEAYDIDSHGYIPKAEGELTAIIDRVEVGKQSCTYECETFPSIIITLLYTKQKDDKNYQPRGTIVAALETYQTIITFKE